MLHFEYCLKFTDQGMCIRPAPAPTMRLAVLAVLFVLAIAVWTMVPVAWGKGPTSARWSFGLMSGGFIFLIGCLTFGLAALFYREAARAGPILQFDGASVILGNNALTLPKADLRGSFVVKGKAREETVRQDGTVRNFPVVMIGFVINENGQQRDIVIGFHTHTHWKPSIDAFECFCERLGIVMERIQDRTLLDARRLPLEYCNGRPAG